MKSKILVVDDQKLVRDLLTYRLEAEKCFDVCVTGSGNEAIIMVQSFEPDLIILDTLMPDLSGIEVCRRVKSEAKTKDIKIIFLTGRGRSQEKNEGLSAGADEFMTKPFRAKEVLSKIQKCLNV